MSQSTNLALPYLAPAQAQKHVTINESLRRLDALIQLSAISATTIAQPASPADGAVYILPAGKTGSAWGAMANGALAYYRDGAWEQIIPREGWLAYAQDSDQLLTYTGSAWSQAQSRAALGLGSAAIVNTGTSGANVPLLNGANTWATTQTFAGVNVGAALNISNTDPTQDFIDTDAAANEGRWRISTFGASFALYAVNDALTAFNPVFSVPRTGATPTSIILGANTRPSADNAFALGSASARFSQLYAASGTINTSDAREKTALEPIPDGVKRAVRQIMAGVGVFQWLASVKAKGGDMARLHVGVTAQAVRDAFEAQNEDPARWALFCADSTPGPIEQSETPNMRLGLRYDQLVLLALAVAFDWRSGN